MGLEKNQRILDMGCGIGRHTLELGRRGFQVTGVDISSGMLDQARIAARKENLNTVNFQQADATSYITGLPFERAYCVCEGSLGLIGVGQDPMAHDMAILRSLFSALTPGGRLLIMVLNAMRLIRMVEDKDVAAGVFDPSSLTESSIMSTGEGEMQVTVNLREHGFVIPELRMMLETAGFEVVHIGGGTAGKWGIRMVELDEYELMAIGKKPDL